MTVPQSIDQIAEWIHEHWCDTEEGDWEIRYETYVHARVEWIVSLTRNAEGNYDPSGKAVVYEQQIYQFRGETQKKALVHAMIWLRELIVICDWKDDDGE